MLIKIYIYFVFLLISNTKSFFYVTCSFYIDDVLVDLKVDGVSILNRIEGLSKFKVCQCQQAKFIAYNGAKINILGDNSGGSTMGFGVKLEIEKKNSNVKIIQNCEELYNKNALKLEDPNTTVTKRTINETKNNYSINDFYGTNYTQFQIFTGFINITDVEDDNNLIIKDYEKKIFGKESMIFNLYDFCCEEHFIIDNINEFIFIRNGDMKGSIRNLTGFEKYDYDNYYSIKNFAYRPNQIETYYIDKIDYNLRYFPFEPNTEKKTITFIVCPEYCYDCCVDCDNLRTCNSEKSNSEITNIIFKENIKILNEKIKTNTNDYILTYSYNIRNNYSPYIQDLNYCAQIINQFVDGNFIVNIVFDENVQFKYLNAYKSSTDNNEYIFTLDNNNISICDKLNIFYNEQTKQFQEMIICNENNEYVYLEHNNLINLRDFLIDPWIINDLSIKIFFEEDPTHSLTGIIKNKNGIIYDFQNTYQIENFIYSPTINNVYYLDYLYIGVYNGLPQSNTKKCLYNFYICPDYCYYCDSNKFCKTNKTEISEIYNVLFNLNQKRIGEEILYDNNKYIIMTTYLDDIKLKNHGIDLNYCEDVIRYIKSINGNIILISVLDNNKDNENNLIFLKAFTDENVNQYLFTLTKENISICNDKNIFFSNQSSTFEHYSIITNRIEYTYPNIRNKMNTALISNNKFNIRENTKEKYYFLPVGIFNGKLYYSSEIIFGNKYSISYFYYTPYGNKVYYSENLEVGVYTGVLSEDKTFFKLYICPNYCYKCTDQASLIRICYTNYTLEMLRNWIINDVLNYEDQLLITKDNEGEIYTYELSNDVSDDKKFDLKNCEHQIRKTISYYNKNFILSVIRQNNEVKYISIFTINGEYLGKITDLTYCENTNFYYEYILKKFLECHNTCETCDGSLITNCLTCINPLPIFTSIHSCQNNFIQCIKDYYLWYVDSNNKLYCVNDVSCPHNFNNFIKETKECISSCENLDNIYNNKGFTCMKCNDNQIQIFANCFEKNQVEDIINEISKDILFMNSYSNYFELLNNTIEIYEYPSNDHLNLDLDECENNIMKYYDKIIVLKNEIYDPVYNYFKFKLFDLDGIEINLDICNKKGIKIRYDNVNLNLIQDKLDNFNLKLSDLNNDFFNDICLKFIYNNKDIALRDRMKIFEEENILCKDHCRFISINLDNQQIICKCLNDNNTKSISFINRNCNFKILKCTNYLHYSNSYNNKGFITYSLLLGGEIICLISYIIFGKKIIFKKLFINIMIGNPPKKQDEIIVNKNKKENKIKDENIILSENKFSSRYSDQHNSNYLKDNAEETRSSFKDQNYARMIIDKNNKFQNIINDEFQKKRNYKDMNFDEAFEYDKRKFKEIIIDNFCYKVSSSRKILLITISNILFYLILILLFNTIFYSQNLISKNYYQKLNFFSRLWIIIISSFFTYLIWYSITYFSDFQSILINLEKEYFIDSPLIFYGEQILRIIKRRLIIYFFLKFLIYVFCTIYFPIFFNIYNNSKKEIFINCLISVILGILVILILLIIETRLRIISLNEKNLKKFVISQYIGEIRYII